MTSLNIKRHGETEGTEILKSFDNFNELKDKIEKELREFEGSDEKQIRIEVRREDDG